MRLTGFNAIEYAERQSLKLNKLGDDVDGPAYGLTIAEAEAIASEDESLVYLDVPDEQYEDGMPSSFEPDR